jgi:hypothetical protein
LAYLARHVPRPLARARLPTPLCLMHTAEGSGTGGARHGDAACLRHDVPAGSHCRGAVAVAHVISGRRGRDTVRCTRRRRLRCRSKRTHRRLGCARCRMDHKSAEGRWRGCSACPPASTRRHKRRFDRRNRTLTDSARRLRRCSPAVRRSPRCSAATRERIRPHASTRKCGSVPLMQRWARLMRPASTSRLRRVRLGVAAHAGPKGRRPAPTGDGARTLGARRMTPPLVSSTGSGASRLRRAARRARRR